MASSTKLKKFSMVKRVEWREVELVLVGGGLLMNFGGNFKFEKLAPFFENSVKIVLKI